MRERGMQRQAAVMTQNLKQADKGGKLVETEKCASVSNCASISFFVLCIV